MYCFTKLWYNNIKKLKGAEKMRIIKWTFGSGDSEMKGTELSIGNKISISKGQYKGLQFSLVGFGLTKFEREFFNSKFLQFKKIWTLYLGKLIIQYNKDGIYDSLHSVNIYIDKPAKAYITEWIQYIQKKAIDKINHLQFKKQFEFGLDRYWEGYYKFTSDLLSAFQLAGNYEADLYFNNRLIFSPLGWEWEENRNAVIKYLGKKFINKHGFELGYKNPYDKEIKNYKHISATEY